MHHIIFRMAASSSSMDQGMSEEVWDFVNTEKYPCLYNTKMKEYNNRAALEKMGENTTKHCMPLFVVL